VLRLTAIRKGRSVRAKISGEGVVPGEYFFGFYKTGYVLLSDSANCNVLRAVVLTQYRRVTDGQTDGIAIANAALAMLALRRAVKMNQGRITPCRLHGALFQDNLGKLAPMWIVNEVR